MIIIIIVSSDLHRHCDPPILTLPDELLEISLFWYNDSLQELRILSRTCRRFRRVLLPKIYRTVTLRKSCNDSRLHLLSSLPVYGHLIRHLHLRIPGPGSNFRITVEALRAQCEHLTNLQTLDLDIQLLEGIRCPTKSLDTNKMGVTEVRYWRGLFKSLPRITELRLSGLTWEDAVKGFAKADLSNVHTLCLRLPPPMLTMASARSFNHTFTGLVNILFAHEWCPHPDWICQAFANRELQSIVIAGSSWHPFNSGHDCIAFQCNWVESFTLLVKLNSTSLTSLTLTTSICLKLALDIVPLPNLVTLKLHRVCFNDNTFDHFMRPFLQCPLQHLSLDDCQGIPESFCAWFDPSKTSKIWPDLQSLSFGRSKAKIGLGDKGWYGGLHVFNLHFNDEWAASYWRSHSRLALQDYCVRRGIVFDSSQWGWFNNRW